MLKVRAFGAAMVVLMTVSTLAGAGMVVYRAASGQAAGTSLQSPAHGGMPAGQTGSQPGDNLAVSAFKLVCPFH